MIGRDPERLFHLLPAFHQARDSDEGSPLRALMLVMQSQYDEVLGSIDELYEEWFIETCQEWAVPYIAALVDIPDLEQQGVVTGTERAWVGNVLRYRQSKGVAGVLQPLTWDACGWPARTVELRSVLVRTQDVRQPQPDRAHSVSISGSVNLDPKAAFSAIARTARVAGGTSSDPCYAPRSVAQYVWRLGAHPLRGVTPKAVIRTGQANPVGCFTFDPLGDDRQLFHVATDSLPLSGAAKAESLPVPITVQLLARDLSEYRARSDALPPAERPSDSDFYGGRRALSVWMSEIPVSPTQVISRSLETWSRPPAGCSVLRSGDLSQFPTVPTPCELAVTIGDIGPFVLVLKPTPKSLKRARRLVESGVRAASEDPGFADATVLEVDGTLLIMPGVRGTTVQVGPTTADPNSASLLKLAGKEVRSCALSSPVADLAQLAGPASLRVTLDEVGPYTLQLAPPYTDLGAVANALGGALRDARPDLPLYSQANVIAVGQSLLVLQGPPPQPPPGSDPPKSEVVFSATSTDTRTVALLGLLDRVAIDPTLGRLCFSTSALVTSDVTASYAQGLSGDIGGGPYPRGAPSVPADVWRATIGPEGDFTSLFAAMGSWRAQGSPPAALEITDSATYELSGSISIPSGGALALWATMGQRPCVVCMNGLEVVGPAEGGGSFGIDGLLWQGVLLVSAKGAFNVHISNSTVVPRRGPAYRAARGPALGTARWGATATQLQSDDVLVAGGMGTRSPIRSAERFDAVADEWLPVGSMVQARVWHAAVPWSPDVLIFGGQARNGSARATVERFVAATNKFNKAGTLSHGRWLHTATDLTDGTILVVGGRDASGGVAAVELYDPQTGSSIDLPAPLGPTRWGHTAVFLPDSGKVLIQGGLTRDSSGAEIPVDMVQLYDPETQTFAAVTDRPMPGRTGASATLVEGSQVGVLVAGGRSQGAILDEALMFAPMPPGPGGYTSVGTLPTPRWGQTATVGEGSQVLLAGGMGVSGPIGAVDSYDEALGRFTSVGELPTPVERLCASRTSGGRILVMGGRGVGGKPQAGCEILSPIPGQYPDPRSVQCTGSSGLSLVVARSLLGQINSEAVGASIAIEDSIVNGFRGSGAPALMASGSGSEVFVERSTVLGTAAVDALPRAQNSIFQGAVTVQRVEQANFRFCYLVPEGSSAPPQFRCQPLLALQELAAELGLGSVDDLPADVRAALELSLVPTFTSTDAVAAGYAQLGLDCAAPIRAGGSNGSEMGALNRLASMTREQRLARLLEEFLPIGSPSQFIYIT